MPKGHKENCQCNFCKNKRREIKDRNHPAYKHGGTGTRLYITWNNMIKRCRDKNNKSYGGKGIIVCPEWKDKKNGQHILEI